MQITYCRPMINAFQNDDQILYKLLNFKLLILINLIGITVITYNYEKYLYT